MNIRYIDLYILHTFFLSLKKLKQHFSKTLSMTLIEKITMNTSTNIGAVYEGVCVKTTLLLVADHRVWCNDSISILLSYIIKTMQKMHGICAKTYQNTQGMKTESVLVWYLTWTGKQNIISKRE